MTYDEIKLLMRSGNLYVETDDAINEERLNAKSWSYEFNHLHPKDQIRKQSLMREMFGSFKNGHIEGPIHFSYGKHIFIGESFYANFNLSLVDDAHIYIGDRVLIAPNVVLSTAGHLLDKETRSKGLQFSKDIIIEDDVWIGAGVIVHPGVTIGQGSVIGSGSVVTKDIPQHCLAYGVPAKVVKENIDVRHIKE